MTTNPGIVVRVISPEEVNAYAPAIAPTIEAALDRRTDRKVEDILTEAFRGDILVWVIEENGEVLGHVTAKPRERELIVITLGGKRAKEWIQTVQDQLLGLIEDGLFDCIVTGARPGMHRWLSKMGWKTVRSIMELRRG